MDRKITNIELSQESIDKIEKDVNKKVGYNGIRPSKEDRINFAKILKLMNEDCTEGKISQSEAFSKIIRSYISIADNKAEEEERTAAIDLSAEIWSASYHTEKFIQALKDMQTKAQNTVKTITDNANIHVKNRDVEIDTLKLKLEEANKEITRLSDRDSIFLKLNEANETIINLKNVENNNQQLTKEINTKEKMIQELNIKLEELERKNREIISINCGKDDEIKSLNREIDSTKKDNEREIKNLNKEMGILKRENSNLSMERDTLKNDLAGKETSISILQKTLTSIEEAKKTEIQSIKNTFERTLELEKKAIEIESKLTIEELKLKISKLQKIKN